MAKYQQMYVTLLQATEEANRLLIKAQQECEDVSVLTRAGAHRAAL